MSFAIKTNLLKSISKDIKNKGFKILLSILFFLQNRVNIKEIHYTCFMVSFYYQSKWRKVKEIKTFYDVKWFTNDSVWIVVWNTFPSFEIIPDNNVYITVYVYYYISAIINKELKASMQNDIIVMVNLFALKL